MYAATQLFSIGKDTATMLLLFFCVWLSRDAFRSKYGLFNAQENTAAKYIINIGNEYQLVG